MSAHPPLPKVWVTAARHHPTRTAIILCSGWILLCSIWQGRLMKLLMFAVVIGLTVLAIRHFSRLVGKWTLFVLATAFSWHYWAQPWSWLLTVALTGVAIFVTSMALHHNPGHWNSPRQYTAKQASISLGIFWVLLSTYAYLFPPYLAQGTDHLGRPHPSPWAAKRVGIALSGGGFRAALMHAGVLAALEQFKVPITHISSVSGGSLISGLYVSGVSPIQFRDAVANNTFNLERDLSTLQSFLHFLTGRTLFGITITPGEAFHRTDLRAKALDSLLLEGRTIAGLRSSDRATTRFGKNDVPRLMINATDLTLGRAIGFADNGAVLHVTVRGERGVVAIGSNDFPKNERASVLIAASGAFPVAFNAVRRTNAEGFSYALVDGGVFDNTGETQLLAARYLSRDPALKDWSFDVALASNAGELFFPDFSQSGAGALRAIDTIYENKTTASSYPDVLEFGPSALEELLQGYVMLSLAQEESGFDFFNFHWPLAQIGRDQRLVSDALSAYEPNVLLYLAEVLEDSQPGFTYSPSSNGRTEPISSRKVMERWLACRAKGCPTSLRTLLRTALDKDITDCAIAFLRCPTLQDHVDSTTAHQLFRLGAYLVVLQYDKLVNALGKSVDSGSTSTDPDSRPVAFRP